MKNDGLNKAINNLPEHNLNEDLWPVIAARLDEEQKLRNAINDLPQHELNDEIWQGIEKNISAKKNYRFYRKHTMQIAAGLLVLIGMGWFTSQVVQHQAAGEIAYSEEMIDRPDISIRQFNPTLAEMDRSIEQFCQVRPYQCNSEAFRELQSQLQQVQQARQEVLQMLEETKNQQLIKYSNRLHNQQVEIKKQMIELVMKE